MHGSRANGRARTTSVPSCVASWMSDTAARTSYLAARLNGGILDVGRMVPRRLARQVPSMQTRMGPEIRPRLRGAIQAAAETAMLLRREQARNALSSPRPVLSTVPPAPPDTDSRKRNHETGSHHHHEYRRAVGREPQHLRWRPHSRDRPRRCRRGNGRGREAYVQVPPLWLALSAAFPHPRLGAADQAHHAPAPVSLRGLPMARLGRARATTRPCAPGAPCRRRRHVALKRHGLALA